MKKYLMITVLMVLGMQLMAQSVSNDNTEDFKKATYTYNTGEVQQVGYFLNGKQHGTWVSYDREGNPNMVANYNNGVKEGRWLIRDQKNPQVLHELYYDGGKLVQNADIDVKELYAVADNIN